MDRSLQNLQSSGRSTFYRIEELDGTRFAESIAGNRLKKFFSRKDLLEDCALREQVLREIDKTTEATQRQFADRHADRLTELGEMVEQAKRGNIEMSRCSLLPGLEVMGRSD